MYYDDEDPPQERDELFDKLRELIDAEVKKEMGVKAGDLKWLQKQRGLLNNELSEYRMKVRQLEKEKADFLKEHTKTVQRELFGGFTVGDTVYYAKSFESGRILCPTCNNTKKVEMSFGERTFVKDCPDCPGYFSSIVYEYKPQRDKVTQINTKLWAGGDKRECEIYLDRRDGSLKANDMFQTIEECQAYCDGLNAKEQEKRRNG